MARTSLKALEIPEGVTLEDNQGVITFTGKLGNMSLEIHKDVDINKDDSTISFSPNKDTKESLAITGTMRALTANYMQGVASGFEKKLAVLHEEMKSLKEMESMIKQSADDARDYTKDIKRDLKDEMHHMSKQLDDIEKRGKEAFRLVRESIDTNDTKVRKLVTDSSERFDNRREQLRKDMDALETRMKTLMKEMKTEVDNKIKKALNNPLSKM